MSRDRLDRLKAYYHLTKPGIVRGNALTAAAGFFLASRGRIDVGLLLAAIAGLSLIMASACVANNYLDRSIDRKMLRTKGRALASGLISGRQALLYAAALGTVGSGLLAAYTNPLCLGSALFGYFAYVVLYGIGKRRSVHGTAIGSISGAVPPVVGYTAVTGRFDLAALILFLILVVWQMPHFYAVAIYRLKDYRAAGLPVLPAVSGLAVTKRHIIAYILAFMAVAPLLTIFGYAGWTYFVVALLLGIGWLWRGLRGFGAGPAGLTGSWAKGMFLYSLAVISVLCVVIAADSWLP